MLRENKKSKVRNITQFGLTAVCVIFFVFLAFAREAEAETYQCDSCSDCRSKISSAGVGDTIELIKDIWNTADLGDVTSWEKACIVFNNKQNITFDCGGCGTGDCVIDGTGQNYGIYFSDGSNSNTIKNCYITGFQYGVYVNYADLINFSYVTANYNIDSGIYFNGNNSTTNSSSNTLSNVTANNNNSSGINFIYSSSNTLSNITANSNGNYGISFQYSNSNTLNNIVANNNNYGFYSSGASAGNNLTNITANSNNGHGIYTSQFNSGSFTNVIVNGNKNAGILLATSNLANVLINVTAVNNSWPGSNNYGIQFSDSDNNTIKDGVIKWNGDEAGDKNIILDGNSSGNTFYNNQFISKDKIKDDGTGTVWDKNGEGNLWEAFDQDGEGCFDADSDGRCDDNGSPAVALTYAIDADSIDGHPQYISAASAHYCNSRDDCNTKIASAKAGDTVYLTKDILNYAGNCINLQNKQNIIFDCQGYTIDKDAVTAGNGVYLDNGGANGSNTVKNCVITDFTIGVYALNSNQNTIVGNTVKANTADVKLTTALNNVFYDNEFLNQGKITDEAGNGTAWDNGVAGNHWEGYDAPAEGCADDGGDGYCDAPYTISSSGAKDNFAKYNYGDPYTCSSCADCTAKISAGSPGDIIKLTQSIADYSGGNCVEFSNKQNITFDCQGYGIDGVRAAGSYGVYILGAGGNDNNTVKNCYITAFTSGVYANNSNGNNFDNIAANYNTYGLYFSQSSSNIFKNSITANYNTGGYGLYFSNSNSNALTDPSIAIAANNNVRGIYFSNSGSNELINLTANNNSDYGVYFSNSSSNILSNVAVNYNATAGMHFSLSGNNTIKDSAGIKFNPININIVSDSGTGNKFYNNDFISKNKITDASVLTKWDDGAGSGNWWQSYDSGDEGCVDGGGGICDTAYNVGSLGTKDNFPEWKKLTDDEYHCTDCASCTSAIAGAMYGDKIILDNHIFGAASDCVNFGSYKEGLTFKSGGDYIIQGSGNYYGIKLDGYNESNTINNVIVSNFNDGINLSDKNNKFNVFSDIMSSYNNNGIYIYKWQVVTSDSNIFTYIVANNNNGRGIYLHYAKNNVLSYSNLFNNSNYGLEFYGGSGSNTVASSTLKLNATDVFVNGSNNNLFYNNQFTSETKITDTTNPITTVWDNGIKGNWWEAYDADGDGCFDSGANPDPNGVTPSNPVAGDELCDNKYGVKTNFDRYPQYKGGAGVVYTCSTCAECNSKIIQAKYGDTVQLNQDIFGAADTCIKLEYKQGITFDCQNHLISGSGYGYGINIKGNLQNDYNTVKKCAVSKFQYGVYISQSFANTLDNLASNNNKCSGNYGRGIYLYNTNFNIITNITANYNPSVTWGAGIQLTNSHNNTLSNIAVNNNDRGIYLESSNNNTIKDSIGIKSNQINIKVYQWNTDNNVFYNNQFTSKTKITDDSASTHWNKWDSGGGDQKPGNQWESFDTAAEGCSDDGTGYCDVKPYWKDKFPKYYGITTNRTCNTCATCNTEIVNALYGEKITLTQDITGVSGDCVKLNYKEGVTFDCDNHKIAGTGAGNGILVNGYGAEYNTIINCDISSFGYGIYVEKSGGNTYKNIVANYNGTGINFYGFSSPNNQSSSVLKDMTVRYNTQGIYLGSGDNNVLTNIAVSNNNGDGISISSQQNYLNNITAEYNNGCCNVNCWDPCAGIKITGSNNTASSSIIRFNEADIFIPWSNSQSNTFYNNEFVSKDTITDNGTNTHWNDWNGADIAPGNHWEAFDAADECYLDGAINRCCTDSPPNGYCDNVYKIDADSIDNYPKYIGGVTVFYCNSCADCNNKIAGSSSGSTIYLANNISNQAGDCLNLSGKQNITFNCQGYGIDGDGDAVGNAVYLANGGGNGGNTVKNCVISDFNNGIYIAGSAGNTIALSTVKTNINKDAVIFDNLSSGNIFYSNEFLNKSKMSDNGANTHWNSWSGAANQEPGNHWQGYDEPAETCNDAIPAPAGDDYCDAPYIISSSGAADNYAKYIGAASQYECDSCSDCNDKIVAAGSGDTIKLTANIVNQSGTCVTFNNKTPGIIFDCQNYAINGDNASLNSMGILLNNSDNGNGIKNCKISGFHYGVYFQNSDTNTAINSEFKWNKVNINLDNGSDNNVFYNNKLISKEKIEDAGAGTIWDNGVDTGNWWEAFDGDNENCFNDGSGICAADYEAESGVFDRYPQYKGAGFNNQNKTCSSCADCSSKIQSAYYGEKVNLDQDINTANADCVDFGQYKEGITLDCQNIHYISGTSGSSYEGVYIHGYGKENNTVKNCSVIGFDYGISVASSDFVNLTNMKIYNSGNSGVYIINSNYNILYNIKTNYSSNYGIYILQSSNNTLTDINASNNPVGLYLFSAGPNILRGANEFKNSGYGIKIDCDSGGSGAVNTITNSIVKQNTNNIYIGVNCTAASGVVNLFYDNEFISKEKMADSGETTKWDNGSKGNWWEAFDWEDEGCFDSGLANGYCDDGSAAADIPYWKDNHPKYKGEAVFNDQNETCSSCADCSSKIQNAYYGETVKLNQNIYTETDCVNFGNYKEGVIFDCDKGGGEKYAITGNGSYTGVYIKGDGVENHTIKNCKLLNFNTGIKLDGSDKNIIENINANNQSMYSFGIYLNYSDNNKLTDINVDYSNFGVYFNSSDNNELSNVSANYGYNMSSCSVSSYEGGFYFASNSDNNEITDSAIKRRNRSVNIADNTSQNNKFFNNHFVSKEKIIDSGTGTMWDNGAGQGNWWEACGDADNNGICDQSPYIIDSNSKDNSPKYEGGEGIVTFCGCLNCDSCADCNAKIEQAKYGETVQLTQDIILYSGSCIKFNNKEGITFDGGGCLTGDCIIGGAGSGGGINVCGSGAENNKIKNFEFIANFTNGIYINQSASNILENIAANNNKVGIYLYQSSGNYLINNIKTNNNTERGVYLSQSNSNLLSSIIANNNISNLNSGGGDGIYFSSSNSNTLINITANNNLNKYSGGGLNFSGSNSNVLTNITANNNSLNKDAWGSIDKGGGIYFSSSNSNILTNIIAQNNIMDSAGSGGGLSFNFSSDNKISFATSTNNYKDGIYFSGSNTNTIASSTINSNSNKDINIVSGSGNIFHANKFISGDKMNDIAANNTHWNWWVGGANAKPGNHWQNYDTAAEGCYDDNLHGGLPAPVAYDGYCDNHYNIKTAVYDEYPIRFSVKPADFSITAAYAGSLTNNSTCENIIQWENNGDADIYQIYRSVNGNSYLLLNTVDTLTNSYIDNSVDYLNNYSYYIEARNGVFTTIADCDYGGGLRLYCKEDSGAETAALYPTICPAVLSVSGVCSAVDLSWTDETPTDDYYILRSVDDETSYQYACAAGDPAFSNPCGTSVEIISDNNTNPYIYQDTDATLDQDYYYKIQNCIGDCSGCLGACECQPDAAGPRDNCYAESDAEMFTCSLFSVPTWKEVKP